MDVFSSLTRAQRVLLWAAVLAGLLLAMLDQTIVGTALPRIARDLDGADWYVWVVTAYLVPATVLLPVAARLSDRHGRRAVLLAGMALFVVGSALCSGAGSMAGLAGCRAVQGCGAAALEALSFTLVAELSGPQRRGAGQAALAAVTGFSFVAGPLLGGVLSDHAGWRSVFWVNVPLGLLGLAVVARVLPAHVGRSESRSVPVDVRGILALTVSVGLLLVGLQQHQLRPDWTAWRTGGLLAAGVAGLVLFAAVERRAVAPVVPPRLVADRVLGPVLLAGSTVSAGLYATVLLVPRYFQQVDGTSATRSGVLVYPLLLALLLAINVGAAVIVRRGRFRGTLLVGSGLIGLGGAVAATFDGDHGPLLLAMVLVGAGIGPALSGLQVVIGRRVAPGDLGAAMGSLLLGRQVGGTVALAAAETLHAGRLAAGASAAPATGVAVGAVAAAGAGLAALALLAVPRGRDRLPAAATTPTTAAETATTATSPPCRVAEPAGQQPCG